MPGPSVTKLNIPNRIKNVIKSWLNPENKKIDSKAHNKSEAMPPKKYSLFILRWVFPSGSGFSLMFDLELAQFKAIPTTTVMRT